MIDIKDVKILYELNKNCRSSASSIAKKTRISSDSVNYRIKRLEKLGVIKGYRVMISADKLGYENFHIFAQLTDAQNLKIVSSPYVRAVIKYAGRYNYEIAAIARNSKEFDEAFNIDADMKILIITKNIVNRPLPSSIYHVQENKIISTTELSLDDTDHKMLKILSLDARMPAAQLSLKLKIPPDTISYRLKKMVRSGIMFIPWIDLNAIGYSTYTVLANIIDGWEKIQEDKNIYWAARCIGEYNVIIYICTKNPDDVHTTMAALNTKRGYEVLLKGKQQIYNYIPEKAFEK